MPTKINFTPDNSSPIFLSETADEAEQPDIGIAPDLALGWSRVLKTTSILIVAAAAVGFAYLYSENTGAFFATTKASLFDKLALKSGTDQPTPTIQTIASTQDPPATATDEPAVNPGPVPVLDDKTALGDTTERRPAVLPSATDAPVRNEVAVAASQPANQQPANQNVTNGGRPSTDALFKQYQAWRAQRAQKQPAQDAKARGVQNARPQSRQQAQFDQDAQAQIRPVQRSRTNVRREQNAQVQNPTVQGASAQAGSVHGRPTKDPSGQNAPAADDPSAQNSQAPSLFQIFKRN